MKIPNLISVCARTRVCTHALVLGKPMDSSTSRVDPCLMVLGRVWRSFRGVTLAYSSSLAAITQCSISMPGPALNRREAGWKRLTVQSTTTCGTRKHVENSKPSEETSIFLGWINALSWIRLPLDDSHIKSKSSAGGGVSHGKSLPLSLPCPRLAISHRGEHVWFLLAPRIRSAEWIIRRDYMSFLPTRYLIYEWILSERRFSLWKVAASTEQPRQLKGQCVICENTGNMSQTESSTHFPCLDVLLLHLKGNKLEAVWWRASRWSSTVEKNGHTSC